MYEAEHKSEIFHEEPLGIFDTKLYHITKCFSKDIQRYFVQILC